MKTLLLHFHWLGVHHLLHLKRKADFCYDVSTKGSLIRLRHLFDWSHFQRLLIRLSLLIELQILGETSFWIEVRHFSAQHVRDLSFWWTTRFWGLLVGVRRCFSFRSSLFGHFRSVLVGCWLSFRAIGLRLPHPFWKELLVTYPYFLYSINFLIIEY